MGIIERVDMLSGKAGIVKIISPVQKAFNVKFIKLKADYSVSFARYIKKSV